MATKRLISNVELNAAKRLRRRPLSEFNFQDGSEYVMFEHPKLFDIDSADAHDAQAVTPYIVDILSWLKLNETKYSPGSDYMSNQKDINIHMRSILVDWLGEVAQEYNLKSETLYLAVNVLDRFLSVTPVMRSKLQLVGVTCMLVAAKYEEIVPPSVEEFVYITDNTYTKQDVLRMEMYLLNTLKFNLTVTTANSFLSRFLKAALHTIRPEYTSNLTFLANYLSELTLQEYGFLRYTPSCTAASVVSLALHTLGLPAWTEALQFHTGMKFADLESCLRDLLRVYQHAPRNQLQSVREKYSHSDRNSVSQIGCPVALPSAIIGHASIIAGPPASPTPSPFISSPVPIPVLVDIS